MYRIIGADGKEYGPITDDVLKKWIREGRLNAHSKILVEGATEWQTLAEIPELAAALSVAPPPVVAAVPTDDGGTSLPPDVRERDYDLDLGACIGRAWTLLTGSKMWLVIGGVAIFILLQAAVSGLAQIPFIGLLFSLASLLIGGPLAGGVYYFVLRCLRGEAADVADVFAGFKYCFGQLVLGQIVMLLLGGAAMLPGAVLVVPGVILASSDRTGSDVAGIVLIVFGALVMLIPLVYLMVGWYFSLALIVDKRLDFWPAMSLSRTVVGKHWWTVLALTIVAGLISGVGFLLCCVGLFFTLPLGMAIAMSAYEELFSRPTTPGVQP